MNHQRTFAGALAATMLAACSGAGGSLPASVAPSPSRAASTSAAQASLVVQLEVPKPQGRRAHYLSPSTKSIAVTEKGKKLGVFGVSPTSKGCRAANGETVCLVTLPVKPGKKQTFFIGAYDRPKGKGKLLSEASIVQTIVPGTNVLPLALSGVVASIELALQDPDAPAGTPATLPLSVMVRDPDGNVIVGPANYETPVALTDSDASGITTLSTSAVAGPGTSVSLIYNGKSIGSATIGASSAKVPAAAVTPAVFQPEPTVLADYVMPVVAGNDVLIPSAIAGGTDGNVYVGIIGALTTGIIQLHADGTTTYFESGVAPSTNLPSGNILGMTSGPGNDVWYALLGGDVGFVTTAGAVTDYPMAPACAGAKPERLIASADGAVWVSLDCNSGTSELAHVKPDGTIAAYPLAGMYNVKALTLGKDGNVYVAGEDGATNLPAVAQAIVSNSKIVSSSVFDVASAGVAGYGNITFYGIAQDANGDLWVTNDACTPSNVTRIHLGATFAASTAQSFATPAGCADTAHMLALPDGTLWFGNLNLPIVTRLTPAPYPAAPAFLNVALPSPVAGHESELALGADGNLYVQDFGASTISSGDVVKLAY
jgi:hypothetical protein